MPTPAAPSDPVSRATPLVRGLRDRAVWVMFAVGLGTGVPVGSAWYGLPAWSGHRESEPYVIAVLDSFLAPATGISAAYLLALLLAPWLDRRTAPFFRPLGHRRAWLATILAISLALTVAFVASAALLAERAASVAITIHGWAAFVTVALLVAAVHAYRIELRPGREQALAFGGLYLGAWIGKFSGLTAGDGSALSWPFAGLCIVFLALALWAVATHPEGGGTIARDKFERVPAGVPTVLVPLEAAARALLQPWRDFFARHGGAAAFLIGAVACAALASSVATYLASQGYMQRWNLAEPDAATRIIEATSWTAYVVYPAFVAGFAIAVAVSLYRPPAKAFAALQTILVAFFVVFALLYLAAAPSVVAGFAVLSLAALSPLVTVIVGVVLARLVARPHTASQIMILYLLFYGLTFRPSIHARLAETIAVPGVIALGFAFALGAFLLVREARRTSPRARAAAQPSG